MTKNVLVRGQHVSCYKYLGIMFSENTSMVPPQKHLEKKAIKA